MQVTEINIANYPMLRELCWNYHLPTIPENEAFARYENGWRHVDKNLLSEHEWAFIRDLTKKYGSDCFLG